MTMLRSLVFLSLFLPLFSSAGSLDLISVSKDFLYNTKTGEVFIVENKVGMTIVGLKLDKDLSRDSFKEVEVYTDAKQRRYVGLRVLNKEYLVSKSNNGSWNMIYEVQDRYSSQSEAQPKKITMLISDKLGIFISIRSATFGQNANWWVNKDYIGEDSGQIIADLVRTFTNEIPRVGVPSLETLDAYIKLHQPIIHKTLSNRFQLLLAETKTSGDSRLSQTADDSNKPVDAEPKESKTTVVDPNKSLSPEVVPDFSIHGTGELGKGRRPGPLYPVAVTEPSKPSIPAAAPLAAQATPPAIDESKSPALERKTIFVKDPGGKPTDAWALIDGVTDNLLKMAEGKVYLEDPDLRKIEDRILRNLLKPEGGGMKLLGPPGTGKSFLLERLAIRFAKGDVPQALKGYQIYKTSAVQLEAGTNYVGTIESTMNALIEVSKQHKILWIVDEAHSLRSMGISSKRPTNALQSLLPGMAEGYMKFLLASTPDNWSAAFDSDPAFDRRLDRVDLIEATHEQLILRLKNWGQRYQLPNLSDSVLERVIFYSGEFAIEGSQMSKATSLLSEIASLKMMNSDQSPVSDADVMKAAKELYNVDPAELESEKKVQRYRTLQASFDNLVGQEEAKESILRNTRQVFAGVVDRNKPRQRVLLAGLKGQGKTEMIRLFADSMGLPSDNRLVMSEYSTSYDVNRMKERIAQLVRRNPFTVLFFDEIEKAHPDVQKALLGILDSATMTYTAQESAPIKISLRNASVFMATNAGSDFIMRNSSNTSKVKMGFINGDSAEAVKEVSSNQFRQALIADGLNEYLLDRMSVVTPFKVLTKDEFKKVLEIHFKKGIREIERNSKTVVEIKNLPELINSLGEKLYFPGVSNREVERIVNDELRQKVADVIFETNSKKVQLNWEAGALQPMISCEGVFVR